MKKLFIENKVGRLIIAILYAAIGIVTLSYSYFYQGTSFAPTSSFIYLPCFIGLFVLENWGIKNLKRREIIPAFIGAFIFASCIRIGAEFTINGNINTEYLALFFQIIGLTLIIAGFLSLFLYYYPDISKKINEIKINNTKLVFSDRKLFIVLLIAFFVLMIPAFLAVYPGLYSYDGGPQVLQVFQDHQLNAHHPVLHTLLLDGLLQLGYLVSGDYNVGLSIYCIVQMLIMSSVFSYLLCFMRRYKISFLIRVLTFLFLAINPIIQIWNVTTTKDTIFAAFFLLLFLVVFELVTDPDRIIKSKLRQVYFVLIVFLTCMFRNQALYVFALTVPFIIIAVKGHRKRVLFLSILAIAIVKIVTEPIYNICGITQPNPREALCLPIQQIARVVNSDDGVISDDQLETIKKYIPEENLKLYDPNNVDYVKEGFNVEAFNEDKISFFKTWFEVGMQNKKSYVISFLYNSYGYWYPDVTPYVGAYIFYDGAWLEDEYNVLNITRETKFPMYDEYLRNVSYNLPQNKIPVIGLIMNQAFPFWVLVIAFVIVIYMKRYKFFVPIILFLGYWGTLLLGPLIAVRYAFPLIVLMPALFLLISYKEKKEVCRNYAGVEEYNYYGKTKII